MWESVIDCLLFLNEFTTFFFHHLSLITSNSCEIGCEVGYGPNIFPMIFLMFGHDPNCLGVGQLI